MARDRHRRRGGTRSCAGRGGRRWCWGSPGVAVLATACGGGVPEPKGPTSRAAPAAAETLTFRFEGAEEGGTERATSDYVREALLGAGYRLTDGDAEADATLQVRVDSTEQQSIITVKVNGKQQRSYDVRVTLAARGGGRVGDQASVKFTADEDEIDEEVLRSLVPRLNGSARFARFCEETRKAQQDAAAAEVRATEDKAKKAARDADERAWGQADAAGCKKPTALTACEGVQAYLDVVSRKDLDGGHVAEAKKLLTAAKPMLAELEKDEAYWTGAKPEQCRATKTKDDCVGVELYLTKFPDGVHAGEARSLVDASGDGGGLPP